MFQLFFCLPLESIFSMHQFWFPKYLFLNFFFFFLKVDSSRSFTHKWLSGITDAIGQIWLMFLQGACSFLYQSKSPKTQIASHWKSGHFRIQFCIHGPCYLPLVFAVHLLLPQGGCWCDYLFSCVLGSWGESDGKLWTAGCGLDALQILCPSVFCTSELCQDVLLAAVAPCPWPGAPGLLSAEAFSKVMWTPEGRQGSYMCPFLWVCNSLARSDWEG